MAKESQNVITSVKRREEKEDNSRIGKEEEDFHIK